MIKYMVTHYAWSIQDSWLNILEQDIPDIQLAEKWRSQFLKSRPDVHPDNVAVIQYRE